MSLMLQYLFHVEEMLPAIFDNIMNPKDIISEISQSRKTNYGKFHLYEVSIKPRETEQNDDYQDEGWLFNGYKVFYNQLMSKEWICNKITDGSKNNIYNLSQYNKKQREAFSPTL